MNKLIITLILLLVSITGFVGIQAFFEEHQKNIQNFASAELDKILEETPTASGEIKHLGEELIDENQNWVEDDSHLEEISELLDEEEH